MTQRLISVNVSYTILWIRNNYLATFSLGFFFSFPLILRKSNKSFSKTLFSSFFSLFDKHCYFYHWKSLNSPYNGVLFLFLLFKLLGACRKKRLHKFLRICGIKGFREIISGFRILRGFRNHGTGATKCWRYLMVHFNGQRTWFQVWDKRMYKVSRAQNNLKLLCI